MTTVATMPLRCPSCGECFTTETFASTNYSGQVTTDLRRLSSGYSPLPLEIHTCPWCGFTGTQDECLNQSGVPENIKRHLRHDVLPRVQMGETEPWHRYQYAAWMAEWAGAPAEVAGELYQKAGWCCEDAGEQDEVARYQREAVRCFVQALGEGRLTAPGRALYTYLVGELHRRLGDAVQSASWLQRVEEIAGFDPEQQWLVTLAKRQKIDPTGLIEADETAPDSSD